MVAGVCKRLGSIDTCLVNNTIKSNAGLSSLLYLSHSRLSSLAWCWDLGKVRCCHQLDERSSFPMSFLLRASLTPSHWSVPLANLMGDTGGGCSPHVAPHPLLSRSHLVVFFDHRRHCNGPVRPSPPGDTTCGPGKPNTRPNVRPGSPTKPL